MSNKLTLYYSVESGGDGSAYPVFFDTEELAEWHQNHLDEGWGESCTGTIVVKGDNLQCGALQSKEGYYLELLLDGFENSDEVNKFKSEFFPDGLPEFTVKKINSSYYGVFVEDRLVYEELAYPEKKTNAKGVKRVTEKIAGEKQCSDLK